MKKTTLLCPRGRQSQFQKRASGYKLKEQEDQGRKMGDLSFVRRTSNTITAPAIGDTACDEDTDPNGTALPTRNGKLGCDCRRLKRHRGGRNRERALDPGPTWSNRSIHNSRRTHAGRIRSNVSCRSAGKNSRFNGLGLNRDLVRVPVTITQLMLEISSPSKSCFINWSRTRRGRKGDWPDPKS
jgi:hypothetical protein